MLIFSRCRGLFWWVYVRKDRTSDLRNSVVYIALTHKYLASMKTISLKSTTSTVVVDFCADPFSAMNTSRKGFGISYTSTGYDLPGIGLSGMPVGLEDCGKPIVRAGPYFLFPTNRVEYIGEHGTSLKAPFKKAIDTSATSSQIPPCLGRYWPTPGWTWC